VVPPSTKKKEEWATRAKENLTFDVERAELSPTYIRIAAIGHG